MDTVNTQSEKKSTQNRKAKHLSICSDPREFSVESGTTGFEGIHFVHHALPELNANEVDTSTFFAGQEVSYPFFISCMTGGSDEGFRANKNLAVAAQEANIPVGTGSIRVLFETEEVFEHFHLKTFAPDVPVMANIGGVQLRDINHARIIEMVKRLEVQALVVHLNPGQELFQPDGDRDFRGIKTALYRYCELSPIPVIVKETGFGITPSLAEDLLDGGVAYVDVAGSGGTNWISVESYRNDNRAERESAKEFEGWGLPTAFILAGLGDIRGPVLASGGIRTGMDVAKSIALGAELAGLALPFIRAEVEEGIDGIRSLIDSLATTLRNVMVLTGAKSVRELKRVPLWYDGDFSRAVESIRAAGRTAPYLV
jgi:isopentenyl-diphosphate delta-isomerase type 2